VYPVRILPCLHRRLVPTSVFSSEAWEDAREAARGSSRTALFWVAPEWFLSVALPGYNKKKQENVDKLVKEGVPLREIPHLALEKTLDDPRVVQVIGHEGRHRARALMKAYPGALMPVRIRHDTLRWSQYPPSKWPTHYLPEADSDKLGAFEFSGVPIPDSQESPTRGGNAAQTRGNAEPCPCLKTDDPLLWLLKEHAEIDELVNDVLQAKSAPAIRAALAALMAELVTHFLGETAPGGAFSRLQTPGAQGAFKGLAAQACWVPQRHRQSQAEAAKTSRALPRRASTPSLPG
jgi:hypothetical protein